MGQLEVCVLPSLSNFSYRSFFFYLFFILFIFLTFSPLYAVTVSPRPKHVLIFIDRGYGIGENSWKIAKQAAEVALKSLSERDKVSLYLMRNLTICLLSVRTHLPLLPPQKRKRKKEMCIF